VVGALDAGIGPVKDRDRGLSAGHLLVGVAFGQLCGADFWSGRGLTATGVPASTTAAGLTRRFTAEHVAGIEAGLGTVYRPVDGAAAPGAAVPNMELALWARSTAGGWRCCPQARRA